MFNFSKESVFTFLSTLGLAGAFALSANAAKTDAVKASNALPTQAATFTATATLKAEATSYPGTETPTQEPTATETLIATATSTPTPTYNPEATSYPLPTSTQPPYGDTEALGIIHEDGSIKILALQVKDGSNDYASGSSGASIRNVFDMYGNGPLSVQLVPATGNTALFPTDCQDSSTTLRQEVTLASEPLKVANGKLDLGGTVNFDIFRIVPCGDDEGVKIGSFTLEAGHLDLAGDYNPANNHLYGLPKEVTTIGSIVPTVTSTPVSTATPTSTPESEKLYLPIIVKSAASQQPTDVPTRAATPTSTSTVQAVPTPGL